MWNGVGGSTNVYGALWPRYRPSDFRKGTEHGLAARLADQPTRTSPPTTSAPTALIGVSRPRRRPRDAAAGRLPDPALAACRRASRRLAQAFDRLGWHWWPVPAGVISRDYDGRLGLPRLRHLQRLPARLDEQVLDSRSGRRRSSAGVELRTYARVLRIEKGRDGPRRPARSMSTATPAAEHFQKAEVVILAANGVGTPRLLLASDNLANSSDQVGRNLLHHTLVACEMWVDEPLGRAHRLRRRR